MGGQVSMGLAAVLAALKPDCGLQSRVGLADTGRVATLRTEEENRNWGSKKTALRDPQRPVGETGQDGGKEKP